MIYDWLEETPLPDEDDVYHVLARSAFGELLIWGERNYVDITLKQWKVSYMTMANS